MSNGFQQKRNRQEYGALLEPPPEYELEFAVCMTYSLELDSLLGAMWSLGKLGELDDFQQDAQSGTPDPMNLFGAVRHCAGKIAVFCNNCGIHMPVKGPRKVYALLESSIFEVQPSDGRQNRKNFHPKLWVIKYRSGQKACVKVLVLTRNLTSDQSLDFVVEMSGEVTDGTVNPRHQPLADMLEYARKFAKNHRNWNHEKWRQIHQLMNDVLHVPQFEISKPFDAKNYEFLPLGIQVNKTSYDINSTGLAGSLFGPKDYLICFSPFLTADVLGKMLEQVRYPQQTHLLTRAESLTPAILPKQMESLEQTDLPKPPESQTPAPKCFHQIWQVKENLQGGTLEDETATAIPRQQDIHAKLYFTGNGSQHSFYVGSSNATRNGFYRNVEFLLRLQFQAYHGGYKRILDELQLNDSKDSPYEPAELPDTVEDAAAEDSTPDFRNALEGLEGHVQEDADGTYRLELEGLQACSEVRISPLYREDFRPLQMPICWEGLKLEQLSCLFIVEWAGVRILKKLPIDGIPEGRDKAILKSILPTPTDFLHYVSWLFAEDKTVAEFQFERLLKESSHEASNGSFQAAGLYERMLRAAVSHPEYFQNLKTLIDQLDSTTVPESFQRFYKIVQDAITRQGAHR